MSKTGEMIKKPRLGIFLELWAMMMGLVLLTVGCMWFGQVLFLEKNYADATLASARERPADRRDLNALFRHLRGSRRVSGPL